MMLTSDEGVDVLAFIWASESGERDLRSTDRSPKVGGKSDVTHVKMCTWDK
jgi:hypothetical protein